ncbi:MAG: sensor histidine kinase [Chloroflexi bacterium]|nr:sensor histidine kinase [Chloroflexota bacterium]
MAVVMRVVAQPRQAYALVARFAFDNPIAFFYLFRCLTWLLAVALVYFKAAPEGNRHYQPGLLMYAALQLSLGLLYTTVLRPRMERGAEDANPAKLQWDLLVAGIADMFGSLAILFWSGGVGTPFFHYVVTSLMVPSFLLSNRWGHVLTLCFAAAYAGVAALAGEVFTWSLGMGDPGYRSQINRDVASLVFIGAAVLYLGRLFRSLQVERRRTKQALDETQMLFALTQDLVRGGTEMQALLTRLAQIMRATGIFGQWALLFRGANGRLEPASATVGIEEINVGLAEDALHQGHTLTGPGWNGGPLQAAVPLKVGDETLGVMVAGGKDNQVTGDKLVLLAEAVGGQIAIGIQNAALALQKADLAAQEERSRIAREIHDGVAQSIYMLSLHLETCAELASQGRQDLPKRLEQLVGLSKQALLEVRHYVFDLKPYMAGEQSADAMVASQVNEFAKVSGIAVSFAVEGEPQRLPIAAATCLYRVTQEALANVFRHAKASRVEVALAFLPGQVRLTVADNGKGFDVDYVVRGHGLENMRYRTQEAGGAFTITSEPGTGTQVRATIAS